MKQDFSGVTDEGLARLFPIILCGHDPVWKDRYIEQAAFVGRMIGRENIVRISHCGSTAVPGLIAKPTIDILLEIADDADVGAFRERMVENGCVCLDQPRKPPPRIMFLKGYTPTGFLGQAVHIHVRYRGDWDELYFRDYLIAHSDVAQAYGRLKLALKERYEYDRDGYTGAKADFVREVTRLAREEFGGRYAL